MGRICFFAFVKLYILKLKTNIQDSIEIKPVLYVMDKTKKQEQIVYLSDLELDGEVRNGYSNIKLESHQSFQQISDNKERNILYVTGESGSGISYYSAEYIHQYI